MSDQVNEAFEESGIFQESLSKWIGMGASFCFEDFDPAPIDLHTAASIGETEVVRDILDEKAVKINALNHGGWSALMYASYMGHSEAIQVLLEIGADPNQRTPRGSTSLILAAMCGYDSVMAYILKKGGDLEAKDNKGWTALFHAVSSGHQQTTEFLIKAGANLEVVEPTHRLTPVMEAAASGHESIVQQLLEHGVNISCADSNGDDAQALAGLYGHFEVAQLIEDYKYGNRKSKAQQHQKASQGSHSDANPTSSYGSSGPSIHAGPREFAKMTGLGTDGKPKPNAAAAPLFLQEPKAPSPGCNHFESGWKGPKDLAALLDEIGCSKHLPLFKEQDIDLRIFLTLTETDLKEIGITLFGPRRKMVATIARISSSIKTSLVDKEELAYCDSLHLKLKNLELELKDSNERNAEFSAQLAQERQLRSVAEGVLMEQKEFKSTLHRCMDKLAQEHQNLLRAAELTRSQYVKLNQSKTRQPTHRHPTLPSNSGQEGVEDFHCALQRSNDCMIEMQRVLRTFGSTTLASGHT